MMNVWTENVNDCSGTGLGVGGGVLTQPLIHIWENYIKKHRAGGCKSIQKASGESKKNIITGQKNKT